MSRPAPFKFSLGAIVALLVSGETGLVIGRAEYAEAVPAYLIRYQSADDRAVEAWWNEPALELVAEGEGSGGAA